MIETSPCFRVRSEITKLKKINNNQIAIATALHGVKIFTTDSYEVTSSISNENLNSTSLAIAFSKNGEFMAFTQKHNIHIIHMPSKIEIKKINTDFEIVDNLEFDLNSKYILAGTKTGRVLQYRYDGSFLLARLYSFNVQVKSNNSIVSTFAFKNDIMACGGNNGVIFTINLHSRANQLILNNDINRVNSILFFDNSNIISGDSKGSIFINSLTEPKNIKKIETGFTNIRQLVLINDAKYLLVTSDTKNVAIYDLKEYKLLNHKYLEFDSVVKKIIISDTDTLLVSLENNYIQKVKLPNTQELRSLIIHNSLDKAYKLIENHPMLQDTQEYLELEKIYSTIYDKALKELTHQNINKALQLTNIFKNTNSKKDEIQLLYKAFENYARFKYLSNEKKHSLAYALSSKFTPLTKTLEYKKMEDAFNEIFLNAQRQIALGKVENAKSLLKDYATVLSKRPLIQLVVKHNQEFLEFIKALEVKDYKTIYKISKNNPLFKTIPSYEKIDIEVQNCVNNIQKDIEKCDIKTAIEKLTPIKDIDKIKTQVKTQVNELRAIKKLQDSYESKNFIKCYELIDKHASLNDTELGLLLQRSWFDKISRCEQLALKGRIKDIKIILGELIHLESRRDKVGDLFRVSFHSKIKAFLAQKEYKKAEALIYSYIDIFGSDNELMHIMQLYESVSKTKLAITLEISQREMRDKWVDSVIIMGS